MRMQKWLMFLLASMALVGVVLALDAVRDDAGDTLRQVTAGEGNPAPPTTDATNRLWVRDENSRGRAHTAITKNTWTALSTIGNAYRYFQIFVIDDTASETAVITVWGSEDGGTTYYPMVRADTLADCKSASLAVGTERIGSGTYSASVVVAVGPATHIYVQEKTAPAAGTYTYEAGGL